MAITHMLRLTQLLAVTGLSRSTVYAKSNPKSRQFDPTFPKSVPLGARSVAWPSDQVEAWIKSRIEAGRSLSAEEQNGKTRHATNARRNSRTAL